MYMPAYLTYKLPIRRDDHSADCGEGACEVHVRGEPRFAVPKLNLTGIVRKVAMRL